MLASLLEGKSWITERIIKLNPMIVLDIGVGSGTYSRLLKPALDPVCVFIGFETYAPYVEKYNLNEHYHAIITEDVRKILVLPDADVVILGDVLEHMTYVEAALLVERSRRAANQAVFLSTPIIEWGTHEAHLYSWDHDMVMDLGGVTEYWTGPSIGMYMLSPNTSNG